MVPPTPGSGMTPLAWTRVTSYKYLAAPQPDQEAVWIPVPHPTLGFDVLKDSECAISADGGNLTAVNPASGRLFSSISPDNGLIYAGAYSPLLGKHVQSDQGFRTDKIQVLVLRPKIQLQAASPQGKFACFKDMVSTTGVNLGPIRYVKDLSQCIHHCMTTAGCTSIQGMKGASQAYQGLVGCQLQKNETFIAPNATAAVDITCFKN